MNKLYILIIAFVSLFAIGTTKADAQYGCPPYGAECPPASVLVVDKTIRDPRAKGDVYVDNLTLADYKFAPGEDVIFKITIKNTSDKSVENVEGIDTLPLLNDVLLASGDTRSTIRQITKTVGTLGAGETKTWYIRSRVKGATEIPNGTVCGDPKAINRVVVRSKDMPDTSDTSSFCIQRSVLGATKQPEAGSEMVILAGGLLSLAAIGFFGNKYSNLIVR
jgi:uncharacterized repeat protein (TIGR01451 family)